MGGLCSVGGQGDACALASARLRSETASDKMMVPVLFHRVLRRRRKEPALPRRAPHCNRIRGALSVEPEAVCGRVWPVLQ